MVLQNDIDLLNPPAELEKKKHKLKRLVQSPNSFFMCKNLKCVRILMGDMGISGFVVELCNQMRSAIALQMWGWTWIIKEALGRKITTVFSHSQTVVVCGNCQTVLCQPTGGRARLTEGCSFRRKGD
ncbi:hypothetical protein TIFTF001_031148 [Ficus carica]|uniref:40S ribosomal protein S27 n=1 Tax=Ficus carica TaxID=3494 RepID=A0AA88DWD2_FICCA|nr:hypothetical protein TIFTF001_031148 [Ficus carica]